MVDEYKLLVGPFDSWWFVAVDDHKVLMEPSLDWKLVVLKLEEVVGN